MTYIFGPFRLEPTIPLLLLEGRTVAVPPRGLLALQMLIEHRETAVTKADLVKTVWPDSYVEEGSLAQLISTLRKALAPGFPDGGPIQTIPKVGYRFVADVIELVAEPVLEEPSKASSAPPLALPEPLAAATPQTEMKAVRNHLPLSVWTSLAACTVLALVALAGLGASWHRHSRTRNLPAMAPHPVAIAVLPFRNSGRSTENAWLGLAIQEMLASDLRLNGALRVVPSQEVQRAILETSLDPSHPSADALRRFGTDLNCEHAVAGSFVQQAGRIRVQLDLMDLKAGAVTRTETLERTENALLGVLTGASLRTAQDLGVAPGRNVVDALAAWRNPEAYKLYVEGLAKNRVYDGKGALDELQRSVALDPDFPLAHLELSSTWSALGEESRALDESKQALSFAGQLPHEQQLVIQARAQSANHDFLGAAQTYRALYELKPEDEDYGRLLIQALSIAGKSEEALALAQRLLSLQGRQGDPLLCSVVADMYSTRGNWPKALEWAQLGAEESQRRGASILYERLLTTESQALMYMGQLAAAAAKTAEALLLARQYHDLSGELRALNRTGQIATAQHDVPQAKQSLTAALEIERSQDQHQREIHTLLGLSRLCQSQKDWRGALEFGQRALALAKGSGHVEVLTETEIQVASVEGSRGAKQEADLLLTHAIQQATEIHDSYLQQQAHEALIHIVSKPPSIQR